MSTFDWMADERVIKAALEWFEDEEEVRLTCIDGQDCPTACPNGCHTEPDGFCPHGYPSHLVVMTGDYTYVDY